MIEIKIETERLILRNLNLDDISEDYVNWLNNKEINKYLSCSGKQQTIESCRAYLESYQGNNDKALIGIFLKNNGLHIGNLTLSTINWNAKMAAIGISIGRKGCTGKGFGKEALRAVVEYCFKDLELCRVYAGISVRNIRSLNLYIKCGFLVESILPESSIIDGKARDRYIVYRCNL